MKKFKKILVRVYGIHNEYRFKFHIFVNGSNNFDKKVRIESRKEIAKIREQFRINSYGAGFGRIKYLYFNGNTVKL